jgi:tetratricopeptide (TPR) repeat protein
MTRMQITYTVLSLTLAALLSYPRPAMADLNFAPGVGLAIDAEQALRDDKPEKSIEFGEKALKSMDLSPSFSAYVLNNMCIAYTQMTRFEMAVDSCDKALKFDSDDWRFLNNRANALLGMGDPDSAISDYQTALKDRPDNQILKDNLTVAKKYKYYGSVPLTFSQRRLRL